MAPAAAAASVGTASSGSTLKEASTVAQQRARQSSNGNKHARGWSQSSTASGSRESQDDESRQGSASAASPHHQHTGTSHAAAKPPPGSSSTSHAATAISGSASPSAMAARAFPHHGQVNSTSAAATSSQQPQQSINPRIKKTLADQLATEQGVAPVRKRKRVHYSCAECHRRKHKCDRNIPCQPCLERGLADSCRPFQDGDEFGDERDRLKRLEDLVEGLARAHATLSDDFKHLQKERDALMARSGGFSAQARVVDSVTQALDQEEALKSSTRKEARQDNKRARTAGAGEIDLEREELRSKGPMDDESGQAGLYGGNPGDYLADSGNSLEGGLTREGDSFYGALALPSVSRGVIETQIHGERLELSSNVPLRSASAKVHRLIQEGGASPNVIDELMGCLPPRHESDAMLDWFFRDINDTRLPLHERTFRASYEEIMHWRWGSLRDEEGDDGARHIPFLSFLFVILGIAKQSEPADRCPSDEQARRGALFFLHCARRSMAIASAVRADHIDVLLAALYGARLLITLRQSAESWSLLGVAIRAAQAIGLHRDGTKLGLDAVTTERRRRLWAMIYYMDRTTSMLLGRPQAIDDKTADTLPPSDVDIDVLPRFGPAPIPPAFPPTKMSANQKMTRPPGVYYYIALRHALAKLVARIVEHFQDLSKPRSYADVMQLDDDLKRFYEAIPGPFCYASLHGNKADSSFDEACPWLPVQRYLLNVEFAYVRTSLHRPYLLRSERYKQSREAAFASSKADRIIRREYEREVKWPPNRARNSHLGGVYRKFASALIAGIELLLDPSASNAEELHEYLDAFLNQSTRSADPSQCTKRELAIIKIFKAKAVDPTWCAAAPMGQSKNATGKSFQSAAAGQEKSDDVTSKTKNQAFATSSASTPGASGTIGNGARADRSNRNGNGRTNSNELAQTLLDRLGGMESLQVLNQNQSPSSNSANSLELGTLSGGGGVSSAAGVSSSGTTASLAGLGSLSTPVGLAGPRGSSMGPNNSTPGLSHAGSGTLSTAAPGAYGMSSNLDSLFDGSEGTDWFGYSGQTHTPHAAGPADPSSFPPDEGFAGNQHASDGTLLGLGDMQTPTSSGMGIGMGGSENDFAGWGALVEAIVSGQEDPAGPQ